MTLPSHGDVMPSGAPVIGLNDVALHTPGPVPPTNGGAVGSGSTRAPVAMTAAAACARHHAGIAVKSVVGEVIIEGFVERRGLGGKSSDEDRMRGGGCGSNRRSRGGVVG